MESLISWVLPFIESNPQFATFIFLMGLARATIKPVFSLIHAYVDYTPTIADNELWKSTMESKGMKTFMWLLDYTASIKLKKS